RRDTGDHHGLPRTLSHRCSSQGRPTSGTPQADAADLGVAASHHEIEIPEMSAQVIQHDLHEAACRCGRVHRALASAAAGAAGTVTYGISLQAWCVHLMAAHAIPGTGARS